jgi:hypothetical protein
MPVDEQSVDEQSVNEKAMDGRTVAGWSLLIPTNWYHIALDESRHRRVTAMLAPLFASLSRDAVFPARRGLEQQINSLTDSALAEGSSDVYLLVDQRYGLPLAATCLATELPIPLPGDVPGETLARGLADRPDDVPGMILVEGRECPVIRREDQAEFGDDALPDGSTQPQVGAATLTVTCLDVYLPFPDGRRTLLLSFRTPVTAVADQMVILFQAMAQSLRWRWA